MLIPQTKLFPRFLSSPLQAGRKSPISDKQSFLKIYISQQSGRGLWSWKITKIKLARELVTSFDILYHLQPVHFSFLFCCAIIQILACWSKKVLSFSLKSIVCRNNYMKDKTLPHFFTISPTICHIKTFIFTFFFPYFKKFYPSPLQNK